MGIAPRDEKVIAKLESGPNPASAMVSVSIHAQLVILLLLPMDIVRFVNEMVKVNAMATDDQMPVSRTVTANGTSATQSATQSAIQSVIQGVIRSAVAKENKLKRRATPIYF